MRLGVAFCSALVSATGASFSLVTTSLFAASLFITSLTTVSSFTISSFDCGLATGAVSLFLVPSPSFVADITLFSFFTGVTRERFFLSSLRSSLSLSAATFLVAPTIACSSSIL